MAGQFVLKYLGTYCASTELSTEFLSIYTFHISSLSIFSACELHRSGLYRVLQFVNIVQKIHVILLGRVSASATVCAAKQ